MRFASLLRFTFRFTMSSSSGESRCVLRSDNSTYCENLELKLDEPAKVSQSTDVVHISFAKGSISAKTLEPFQNVKMLDIYICDITHVEDGALGSLPNLKELHITHSNFPTLTRGILRGCHKLQKFRTYNCSVEADALQEIPNVEDLQLSVAVTPSFTKAYLEPLKHLKTLSLELGDLSNVIEPGLFCASPVLEDLKLNLRSSITLTESLFNGCNSMRKLFITGGDIEVDGNIFSRMSNLEEVTLYQLPLKHITKEFLTGVPNLDVFEFTPSGESEIDGDAFENLPHLTSLMLRSTQLHDSYLEALHPLSELVTLNLCSNRIENPECLPYLPNLEHLNLDFNSIKRFSLDNLKKKTPKLKILNLIMNPILPGFIEEEFKNQDTIKVTVDRVL